MYVRRCYREKNGKRHAYWALVESYRTARGPRQRVVAYLGELDERGRIGVQQAVQPACISLLPNDGKMNVQFVANEENQNRAQRGKNESGGMISLVPRAQEHMGKSAPEERSDDAENNRPEDRHVHMHH